MKILVTGCNGYIGSHVVKLLAEKGHTVTGWDINIHGEHNDVEHFMHKHENIDVTGILPRKSYDAVIHLAACKAAGESMINAGIHPGDILVVDRSLEPKNGKIVIAAVDGQLTVKRLQKSKRGIFLTPENDLFKPIKIEEEKDILIWGVVTNVLHEV